MALKQEYIIKSTDDHRATGILTMLNATRGEATKYARTHSKYWKTRYVHVLIGTFPLFTFQNGKEIRMRSDLATLEYRPVVMVTDGPLHSKANR